MEVSRVPLEAGLIRRQIARVRAALSSAIGRFRRDVRRSQELAARHPRRRRRYWQPTRIPALRVRRPPLHRLALPRPMRAGQPMTYLARRRLIEARLRGGRPAIVEAVEGGAGRVADAIRRGLLSLRQGLRRVNPRARATVMPRGVRRVRTRAGGR